MIKVYLMKLMMSRKSLLKETFFFDQETLRHKKPPLCVNVAGLRVGWFGGLGQ